MSAWYRLNRTKCKQVTFSKLPAVKAREIAGNPAAAAITARYLLKNFGDAIAFVSDELEVLPFDSGSLCDSRNFPDMTDEYIKLLVAEGILRDHGVLWWDEHDPQIYLRDIRNAWMPKELLS